MQKWRRCLQAVVLGLSVLLIWKTGFPLRLPVPAESLLRIDPLLALSDWLSGGGVTAKLWPAVGVVVLTLLLGRVFCGWLCPMGTTIDLGDGLIRRMAKVREKGRGLRSLKFYILIFFLLASFLGVGLMGFLDPLSLFVRSLVLSIFPAVGHLFNASLNVVRPLAGRVHPEWAFLEIEHRSHDLSLFTFLILGGILALGLLGRRFWCRNLCPLGALLGVLSRFSLLKRVVDEACTDCRLCQDGCTMASVESPEVYRKSECILCLKCRDLCEPGALRFTLGLPFKRAKLGYDLSRRGVLASLGLSAVFAGTLGSAAMNRIGLSRLIRPPGALSEGEFVETCIKCGECMKVCPTNVLQPVLLEAGFDGIWTPKLVPRRKGERGGCPKYCNLCTRVCPTDALRFLTLKEKWAFRIGLADLYRDRCIAWAWNQTCLVCYDYCPYHAIQLDNLGGIPRPSVIQDKCIGCGICEHRCPVKGSAILVSAHGESREERGILPKPGDLRLPARREEPLLPG